MNAIDILFGFLAGAVSCVTPEAILLFPLLLAVIGTGNRNGLVAIAAGIGFSMVLTGALASAFGFDAVWSRRVICGLLLALGFVLIIGSLSERFAVLTGGHRGTTSSHVGSFRLLLLALLVGANWVPLAGPTLGKASLMAAGERNAVLAFGILFGFGVGASVPWIIAGRILRFVLRPLTGDRLNGVAGKRILGAALVVVAIIGISGLDVEAAHRINASLPAWTGKLAITF